jgi:hypothetical protein
VDGTQPLGIYILAALFYLVPSCFLWAAWIRAGKALEVPLPRWRVTSLRAAFFAAVCATVMSLIFIFSYLHNGGGIHGSQTSPGIWKVLGPASSGIAVVSLLVGVAGRGKGKLLLVGWFLAIFAAEYAVFQLAFD